MIGVFAHAPDFTFTAFRITFPDGRPGLRIVARCKAPHRDIFIVETDDSPAGLRELLDQLAQFQAGSAPIEPPVW